jgi:hypothetical protein
MAFYAMALPFITKPARLAVAKGSSQIKAGMQVILQIGHALLLIVAFALKYIGPM